MPIELFSDYFNTVTLDISEFNEDNSIEYNNVQPVAFELKSLYNFLNIDFDDYEGYYEDYTLDDNDRPDLLAKRLYGNENLWWLLLTINRISWYDLPLKDETLFEMAEALFDSEYKYSSVNKYYEVLKEINEEKRKIKIIKKQYLYLVLRDIHTKLIEG